MRRHRRRDGREDGAVAVEFAAVFIVFVMVLWGLLTYGVVFALQQTLTHAASEAVRASVGLSDTAAVTRAEEVIDSQLAWIGSYRDNLEQTATVAPCDYDPAQSCLTVTVTYPWRAAPIVPSLLGVATPAALTTSATLQRTD